MKRRMILPDKNTRRQSPRQNDQKLYRIYPRKLPQKLTSERKKNPMGNQYNYSQNTAFTNSYTKKTI